METFVDQKEAEVRRQVWPTPHLRSTWPIGKGKSTESHVQRPSRMKGQINNFLPDHTKRWTLDKSHGNTYSKADPCLGYLRAVKTNFVDEALWQYLYRKPRCRTILDKYRRKSVASSVALFPASTHEQRSTYAFLHKTFSVAKASWFFPTCNRICDLRNWFYSERWLTVCASSIYFVIRCEAKFSKVRLQIFKCTWVKCLLETNLACSVKPTIESGIRITVAQNKEAEDFRDKPSIIMKTNKHKEKPLTFSDSLSGQCWEMAS